MGVALIVLALIMIISYVVLRMEKSK